MLKLRSYETKTHCAFDKYTSLNDIKTCISFFFWPPTQFLCTPVNIYMFIMKKIKVYFTIFFMQYTSFDVLSFCSDKIQDRDIDVYP